MIDVTQDIQSMTYQETADRIETVESIRRGLAQAKTGLGRSVDEVFDDLERQP